MQKYDRILGGIIGVAGIICLIDAHRIWNGWAGTGTMALLVGGFLILLSIISVVFTSGESGPINWFCKKEMLNIVFVSGAFALYIICMKWIGYVISTWIFLTMVTKYISQGRIYTILIWTGAVALGTYIIFKRYLQLYLPAGFWG
jgi:hypothetical protein